jgi:hypothetical protein
VLGWGWTLLNPLLMLAVYTFVFSTVFKARWPDLQQAGPLGFAINLFTGLIVFNLFSECIGKAPSLVVSQPSYVTKVIFPLELLGAVSVGAACFHACTSLVVLGLFQLMATGGIPLTEVRLETMESRISPGLHFAGEVLDVDGRIGGFNFQWAWASGYVAGESAAAAVLRSAAAGATGADSAAPVDEAKTS